MARGTIRSVLTGTAIAGLALSIVPATAGARAAAKPSGDPVKVMVIFEKTAGIAFPAAPDGVQAAAKALDKQDGLGGRPVDVIECDTKNDPNVAADCARQAVDEGVVAVLNQSTVQGAAIMPILADAKIPSIGILLTDSAGFTSPASFPTTGGAFTSTSALARFLADDGAKVISLVRPDIAAAAAFKSIAADPALAPLNLAIANDVPVPGDAPDMAPYAQGALANGADGLLVALPGQQAINFVEAVRQVDPEIRIGLVSSDPAGVRKALGRETDGIIGVAPTLLADTKNNPVMAQYRKDMKAAGYKAADFNDALPGWLAAQVLVQMVDGGAELTGSGVFDALVAATDVKTGILPPLSWTTPAIPGTRVFNLCALETRFNAKGRVVAVSDEFFNAYSNEECAAP